MKSEQLIISTKNQIIWKVEITMFEKIQKRIWNSRNAEKKKNEKRRKKQNIVKNQNFFFDFENCHFENFFFFFSDFVIERIRKKILFEINKWMINREIKLARDFSQFRELFHDRIHSSKCEYLNFCRTKRRTESFQTKKMLKYISIKNVICGWCYQM